MLPVDSPRTINPMRGSWSSGTSSPRSAESRDLLAHGTRTGLLAPGTLPADLPPGLEVVGNPVDVDDYALDRCTARLREADVRALEVLVVVPPAPMGVGAAIADRLRRAAGVGAN